MLFRRFADSGRGRAGLNREIDPVTPFGPGYGVAATNAVTARLLQMIDKIRAYLIYIDPGIGQMDIP